MVFGDDDDRNIHAVFVANLGRYRAALAVGLGVAAADDFFVLRPVLIGDEGVMEHDQAGAFVEEGEKFFLLGVGNSCGHVIEDDDVVAEQIVALIGGGIGFGVLGGGEGDFRVVLE